MSIEDLFRGQIEAVRDEFNKAITIYDQVIERALDEQERAYTIIKDTPDIDWKEKAKLDQTVKGAHYRLMDAQKNKADLLLKMGQFAKNDDRWDSEEAVYVILMSVFQIAEKSLSPTQFKKLEKGLNELKNKTVKELKELVTN